MLRWDSLPGAAKDGIIAAMETVRNAETRPRDACSGDVDRGIPDISPSRDARRVTLSLLGAVFAVHLLDRQIFAILIPPIKAEFALSDTALGVLSGLAFTIFFSTIGVVIARLADRLDRARIITVSVALFSAMTVLCGLASGFWTLLAARVGVGVGEGGTNPASHALIADLYPPGERATAAGIYSVGPHLGLVLAFGLGGWLAQAIGWRLTFAAAGVLGVALAIACAAELRDPRTVIAVRASTAAPQTGELVRELVARRSFRHLIAGATLAIAASLGALTWLPALLTRAHGFDLAQAGLLLAIGIGVFGAVGTYAIGRLADRAAAADARRKAWSPLCARC
jgi:predicted MFS family arabinose efflux permease